MISKSEFKKLDAIWDYIEEQKNRADISEDTYNILQKISDDLSEVIYN